MMKRVIANNRGTYAALASSRDSVSRTLISPCRHAVSGHTIPFVSERTGDREARARVRTRGTAIGDIKGKCPVEPLSVSRRANDDLRVLLESRRKSAAHMGILFG